MPPAPLHPQVKRKARTTSQLALHAVAVSSDSAFLAVGGGDKKVHIFDGRTGAFIQSFPGHRWARVRVRVCGRGREGRREGCADRV